MENMIGRDHLEGKGKVVPLLNQVPRHEDISCA